VDKIVTLLRNNIDTNSIKPTHEEEEGGLYWKKKSNLSNNNHIFSYDLASCRVVTSHVR